MFEKVLRRYATRLPITPERVIFFLFISLIVSSLWLYYLTRDPLPAKARYLIYDNPGKLSATSDSEEIAGYELSALRTALILGYYLDRIVILPDFHCARCSVSADDGSCTAREWSTCSFETIYDKDAFDAQFSSNYERASFMSDTLVRRRLETSASALYVVDSALTRTRTQNILPRDVTVLQAVNRKDSDRVSTDELQQMLDQAEDATLLRFHSLYFDIVENDIVRAISPRLDRAFVSLKEKS